MEDRENFDVSRFRIEKLEKPMWKGIAFTLAMVLIFFSGIFLLAGAFK